MTLHVDYLAADVGPIHRVWCHCDTVAVVDIAQQQVRTDSLDVVVTVPSDFSSAELESFR